MSSAVSADQSENEEPKALDSTHFPLVGIGASAGGIRVLQTFFDGMPADSGMAYVVVMHLAPDHESNLAAILQARTAMPVIQVTETVKPAPNHVYVIPPGKHLSMEDSAIHLADAQQSTGRRVAIDLFFRTLAAAYGPRAVCVVLSGTDSDSVIGLKHIKEQGGLTIVQDPTEAEFDSMPRGAIATGMADWILPVAQMPLKLMEFIRNERRMHVPPEDVPADQANKPEDNNSGGPLTIQEIPKATDETALAESLRFLRMQTGHDFSHYKRATILRRVARRLQVNLLEDIPSYLVFLRAHPAEVTALLHDLLISVTNFFRDRDAFAALEAHIPQLFAGKQTSDQLRVWVCGCATGEEAYSIAIMLCEHAAKLDAPPAIQVFATDLDEDVIQIARSGLYPTTIEADVSQERLRRFFQKDQGKYRIRKEVRELVLFSAHDVLKDSPFSRLDAVTCRNLLIYLKHEAQQGVFDIFHFAMKPGGLLFLGSSESMEEASMLFAPLNKRHRLFVRRSTPRPGWQIPAWPLLSPSQRALSAPVLPRLPPPNVSDTSSESAPAPTSVSPRRADWRAPLFGDLHLAMLEQYAPPSVVINANYDIVHLSAHVGQFLQMGGGEPSMNLLKAVHPGLRLELRTALFRAVKSEIPVTAARAPVELNGVTRLVNIHVRPARQTDADAGFVLVVFEIIAEPASEAPGRVRTETTAQAIAPAAGASEASLELLSGGASTLRQLEDENQHLREQVGATVEQYEASLEELKASNEELQAINEEMRSAAEELETGKEELQSINEELTTVNQELKSSVEDLSRANSDLQNLMASTDIGTIFLDRQLCIKRFTPRIQELFNVLPTDIGRPLSDITHKLSHLELAQDAARVLRDLRVSEREVSSGSQWFLERLLPYQSMEDHIDGVVLTFVDITERKRMEEALRASEERYRSLVYASTNAVWRMSADGKALLELDGDLLQRHDPGQKPDENWLLRYVHPDDRQRASEAWWLTVKDKGVYDDVHRCLSPDGVYRYLHFRGVPFLDAQGNIGEWVGTATDVTDKVYAEEAVRQSEERLRLTIENVTDYAIFNLDAEGHVATWNEGGRRMTGYEPGEIIGQRFRIFYTPEDRNAGDPDRGLEIARQTGRYEDEGWRVRKDGSLFWGNEIITAVRDANGALVNFVKITRDLTEYRNAEEQRVILERETTLLAERNRMAQELHDTLSQGFTAIKMQMDAAEVTLQEQTGQSGGEQSSGEQSGAAQSSADVTETLQQHIVRTRAIAQQSLAEARSSIRALRAPLLAGGSLSAALELLVEQVGESVRVRCFTDGTPYLLSAPVENDLYRLAQEALTNALRHSQAQHVIVSLTYFPDQVHLTIKDDGSGFDTRGRRSGFGVTGMQERAVRIGADLRITSQPGQGTEISLTLTLPDGQGLAAL